MNPLRKILLKALTPPDYNLKKNYALHRKFMNAVNPYIRPFYKLSDHKIMAEGREIPVRIFFPRKQGTNRILIFFHGGGWVTGNIDSYTHVCANMANQTLHNVISVDYRLAPENPFPKGLEDCYHVTREIFEKCDFFQCKPEDITLIGDSAGGNLAAAVSLMARDRGEFKPQRQILIYPATNNDHGPNSPFPSIRENGTDYILTSKRIQDYMDLYVTKEEDRLNPYVAPLLEKNLSQQPDTLIITAQYDPLRDEGEAYGLKLAEDGNRVSHYRMEDAVHGFFAMPWHSDYVQKCYLCINSFLNQGEYHETTEKN